jgi:hypothetical protein
MFWVPLGSHRRKRRISGAAPRPGADLFLLPVQTVTIGMSRGAKRLADYLGGTSKMTPELRKRDESWVPPTRF